MNFLFGVEVKYIDKIGQCLDYCPSCRRRIIILTEEDLIKTKNDLESERDKIADEIRVILFGVDEIDENIRKEISYLKNENYDLKKELKRLI
jgi:hypothetical protein